MATLQVRSMDDQLYLALKARAKRDNRSISNEVISILKLHLSQPDIAHTKATNAFLELAGTWEDERASCEIVDDIRKSRSSNRFKRIGPDVFD